MASLTPGVLAGDLSQAALASLSERLATLDASQLMVYLVDLVGADLLQPLAEQFHVLGHEGWNAAPTDQAQRALIKASIEMHKRKGTPWALKRSLAPLGFGVEVIDRYAQRQAYAAIGGLRINGAFKINGSRKIKPLDIYTGLPQIQHWAEFLVRANLSDAAASVNFSLMRKLVDEWKPARSRAIFLFWLGFVLQVTVRAASTAALLKQSGVRYPWPGRVVSDQAGAIWRLGRDGECVTLPQAMGSFRLGELRGAKSNWRFTERRGVADLAMAKVVATEAWPSGSIGVDCIKEALIDTQIAAVPAAEYACRDAFEAEFTAARTRLTRSAQLDAWRRLDGSWRVGSPVARRPFGFRMGRDQSVVAESVGALAIDSALRPHPERLPSSAGQLYVNGRWQVGAHASPAFLINIIKG